MNGSRLDRIQSRIRKPLKACYRVDWGEGIANKCPRDPELLTSPDVCNVCQMVSERYHFKVNWTGPRSGDEDGN